MKKLTPTKFKTLVSIEAAVRGHLLEHVSSEIGAFSIETSSGTTVGLNRTIESIGVAE